ncbi:signal recognition particle receptor subunit alpha [Buchnera aphidicola (Ceratovacuna keduensis)]|uniref:signal recognition particle receptor subunit alpha n=1 Tax=Buchnera aphidicola TaxID=9 RepID=UPI0031B88F0D
MFKNIKENFKKIIEKISGSGIITEKNIKETIREIRKSFLESDVPIKIIKIFIEKIKKKAIGKKINKSFTPGQELINIIQKEMISEFGENPNFINLSTKIPAIILIVGLQGMGKTTSVVKIANFIKNKYKKKVGTFSLDIKRPAAIEQLKFLSKLAKIDFLDVHNKKKYNKILKFGIEEAKKKMYDCIVVDTAGRLHINKKMMNDLKNFQKFLNPIETLLVCDAMIGQDSIKIIKTFKKYVKITGIVLTKTDSDARCGIALSANIITKKPIKFLCNGEKIDKIKIFDPKQIVNKIIGMEDVTSLIKKINLKIKKDKYISNKNKINKNNTFNLNNFLEQIDQLNKIGGIEKIIDKIPFKYVKKNEKLKNLNNSLVKNFKTIILSMTKEERKNPKIIKGSRKKRIALGSGSTVQQVNILLQKFNNVKKMMKKIKRNGIKNFFKNFFTKKIF